MQPRLTRTTLSLLGVFLSLGSAAAETPPTSLASNLEGLVKAYPEFLARIDGNALIWSDGTRMPIDDGKGAKSFSRLLEAPDIKDMFYAPYLTGPASPPAFEMDPGRVRHQPLFDKMYGDCRQGGVTARLVDVPWLPKKWGKQVKVTAVNGVAERVAAVSAELDRLPATFDVYLFPAAGGYNCRPIAGTTRPSAHGHGIAIDIALKHANYWQWSKRGKDGRRTFTNKIPLEIVEVFERHGFIWGGRWYHFDTMHFEYRPELLVGRVQGN